ncbi:MAG: alpha/beta fold hydrolase [Longimicrobiales bacterium]
MTLFRRTVFMTLLGLGMAPVPPLQAQSTPAGTWSGTLSLPTGGTLPLVFHVEASGDGYTATWDSPAQGAIGIPATAVRVDGATLLLEMGNVGAGYEGTLSADGTTLEGTFRQSGGALPLTLTRGPAAAPARPQEPSAPFPYRVEEVRIANDEAGVVLAGTLTLPPGSGPFSGAVLVSGSGPQNRDEELMGHKPFLVLADHLTRQGIAVLRYDDRGVAESTGDFGAATSEDLASDALAALRHLGAHADVDAGRVGIVGHSEGGMIAPMVARDSDTPAYLVLLAGTGLKGLDIIRLQSDLIGRAGGASDAMLAVNERAMDQAAAILRAHADPAAAEPLLRTVFEDAAAEAGADADPAAVRQQVDAQVRQLNTPWFRFFLEYDPVPALEATAVPVLALNGSLDLQVPASENLAAIDAALTRGGNRDHVVRELPGLNHLFQEARTGAPSEYATIEQTMSPVVLAAVSDWINERFGR